MSLSALQRLLPALCFLIASALPLAASGQIQLKTSSAAGTASVTTPYVRAELVAHAPEGVEAGKPLWLGLQIQHEPEWHTYWKNPGDSGLPTELAWTLPEGLDAGEIAWPLPRKIPIGTLANYGYEGTVLLPVPVTVSPQFNTNGLVQDATIQLRASWLVCRKECIPEEGVFTLRLPVRSTTALHAAAFDAAARQQPRPVLSATGGIIPDSQALIGDDNTLQLKVQGLPVALRGKTLDLYPETGEVIDNAAAWKQAWNGAMWTASLPLSAHRSNSPSVMPVVLTEQTAAHPSGPDTRSSYRAELKVLGPWPQVAALASVSPALEAALQANAQRDANTQIAPGIGGTGSGLPAPGAPVRTGASALTLTAALLGALFGGLLLNLMPCVFPVLAIKVVGFAQHHQNQRAHRLSGIAYTTGVVLSFLALGALMLGLRAAGDAVGWGFQLQSPAVVAGLAVLFTLIALNLAGVFELGSLLPSSLASLQARHPVADSLLTGVLAVAVASPCTAPFMGASLGLTATLPAAQALLVFAALGLGLALPYLLASFVPAMARALPRPGNWMLTFRRLMAFPMLATVVWLVWVLGQQSGIDGAASLLIVLVGLALVAWSLSLPGRARLWMAPIAMGALALLLWAFAPHVTHTTALHTAMSSDVATVPGAAAPGGTGASASQPVWQAWSPGKVEQAVAAGQPVFVDFTAAWCVTCQYNKKTTLADPLVLGDMQAKNVVLLRADWTRRDPAITAALQALGRNGVPVYVLHAPGRAPVVMSEILSVDAVRTALAAL